MSILLRWIVAISALTVVHGCSDGYFSDTIKCYSCAGNVNSSCGDPFSKSGVDIIDCRKGACLKWERIIDGEVIMQRTCSKLLDFQLIPINGVCRTEGNGHGYICMCATDECNHSESVHACAGALILTALLANVISTFVQRCLAGLS